MTRALTARLSTAFDGPTLYGLDSDSDGVFARSARAASPSIRSKLWNDFTLAFSLMIPFFRFHDDQRSCADHPGDVRGICQTPVWSGCSRSACGTTQADIFKEVQAQNEIIFPLPASLRIACRHDRFHNGIHSAPHRAHGFPQVQWLVAGPRGSLR